METALNNTNSRTSDRRRRWWPALLIGVLLLGGGFLMLQNRSGATAQAETLGLDGDVFAVTRGDLAAGISAAGQVAPVAEASLALQTAGTVTAVDVVAGNTVRAGDLLVQLDTAALERAVANAEQALIIQEGNLAQLVEPASAADVAAAEAAVASAQQALDETLAGPDSADLAAGEAGRSSAAIRAAEATLLSAEQQVAAATDAYATAWDEGRDWELNDPLRADRLEAERENSADSLALAEANLASARAALNNAYAQYEAADASYDALLRGSSAAQIAAQEASLAQAEANLQQLLDGPSSASLAIAGAQVAQARLSLQEAEANLANASLVAPYNGLITAVHIAVGEQANGRAVDIVNISALELVLNVDENDLAAITLGQAALVTLDAYPDSPVSGTVVAIDPSGVTNSSGIVTFGVHVALGQADVPVLIGMTGDADLVTAARQDVLLVPNAALTADRSAGTVTVERIARAAGGTISAEPVPVTTGLSDGDFTEIIAGLRLGDEVLIGTLTAPEENNGFRPPGF